MWRAHGLGIEQGEGAVACKGAPPRYYPNAVTVDPGADAGAQTDWLLGRAGAADGDFFVKDSFQALQLDRLGFGRLFDATWIRRAPAAPAAAARLEWRPVIDPQALGAWERAWSGGGDLPSIFLPGLLSEPNVRILAGWRDDIIAAGCVVTSSGAVVGVSNVFGDQREALGAAARAGEGRDLVGYENGDDLAGALAAGFEAVGGLSVWVREARENFR